MYIKYNGNTCPCGCKPREGHIVYSGLSEDFSVPVSGDITLCADDGFELRTDTVENYLRQTFVDGVLTLTNTPEPEPIPEPEEYADDWEDAEV